MKSKDVKIVEWHGNLSVGIMAIDIQHRTLLQLTNDLFTGCLYGTRIAEAYFRATARHTVDCFRRHFFAEEQVMEKISYPCLAEHRKRHREFIKNLLYQVGKFDAGGRYGPRNFARSLRDWAQGHIFADQQYGVYYAQKIKAGIISPFQ
jgi:hemerythrin